MRKKNKTFKNQGNENMERIRKDTKKVILTKWKLSA